MNDYRRRDVLKAGIVGLAFGGLVGQVAPTPIFPRLNLLTTGYHHLDRGIGGGIHKGLTCVLGRPGVGKGYFINQIVKNNPDKYIQAHSFEYLMSFNDVIFNPAAFILVEGGYNFNERTEKFFDECHTILKCCGDHIRVIKTKHGTMTNKYGYNVDNIYMII